MLARHQASMQAQSFSLVEQVDEKHCNNQGQKSTGICFTNGGAQIADWFIAQLKAHRLPACLVTQYCSSDDSITFCLRDDFIHAWAPQCDTLQLSSKLHLDSSARADHLECEILLAMLAAPFCWEFPSYEEFMSALRIRANIVQAARRTQLAFHTSEAERPTDYWQYIPGRGCTVLPGKSLITALVKATQPEDSGKQYAFSCYRATEYTILLGITQELEIVNPSLLEQLQLQWEKRPIMSGQFHEVFMQEYGAIEQPLPPKFYVPGDRVWFRNPDEHSSDASGYEGSWVIYLGQGLFSNFWKREQPYTMSAKCVEIYHWRHAVYIDAEGEPRIDETIVETRVRQSMENPQEVAHILAQMEQIRAPKGIYSEGGCIDASRESPKYVCLTSKHILIPDEPAT